jgi:hypothetical protein
MALADFANSPSVNSEPRGDVMLSITSDQHTLDDRGICRAKPYTTVLCALHNGTSYLD